MTVDTAFFVTGANRSGPWVITVDHARNFVPAWVNGGDLGVGPQDMDRHIAYDIGAEGVALALGELLDSPVICSNFSRLVIDPNRGLDDPTLVMQLYDGSIIPANRNIDATGVQARVDHLYQPYHDALARLMHSRAAPAILAMHSFTPQLAGRPKRPWEVGILFADDQRLSVPLIASLQQDADLTVGVNEPYVGHLPGDSVDRHALCRGHLNALIELRNDLIADKSAQQHWAGRLAPHLTRSLHHAKGS
ncbi:MAG: N-formylglutamate amidohydrolase [Pseudomonadota bacterium]